MKLKLQRRDGQHETISIVGPVEVHHGEKMDHLHSADGMDHYFWSDDGTYDGWGMGAPTGDAAIEVAEGQDVLDHPAVRSIIERVERERKIEP